jgi:hypothetical protein
MKNNWIQQLRSIKLGDKNVKGYYSQFGEEPIYDFIFKNIGTTNKFLVDFGAGGLGCEMSNSRYLLNKGWKGLLMDGEGDPNKDIKTEFITQENIIKLFKKYNVPLEFDFLSIDIDGNDYWVLKKILEKYSPRVICAEFNGTIPINVSKAMKYNPTHTWGENDYYGFSFEAGKKLGHEFDYSVVFQLHSTNMYFIRKDLVDWQDDFSVNYIPTQYHAHSQNREWVNI